MPTVQNQEFSPNKLSMLRRLLAFLNMLFMALWVLLVLAMVGKLFFVGMGPAEMSALVAISYLLTWLLRQPFRMGLLVVKQPTLVSCRASIRANTCMLVCLVGISIFVATYLRATPFLPIIAGVFFLIPNIFNIIFAWGHIRA